MGESSAKISLNFDSEEQQSTQKSVIDGAKPSFLERPIIKQSTDLKHVQFDCRLVADPKPTIQWLHKGEPIAPSSKIETLLISVPSTSTSSSSSSSSASVQQQQQQTSSNKQPQTYLATLILKGVDPEQTGDYKCIATNKHGSGTASINLNFVQGKSKIPDGKAPKFPRKPVIKQSGQILTIECIVEANPKPTITWYHDQTTIINAASQAC